MLLLAMDSATPAVTCAVVDGDRVLAQASVVDARRHAELLAPLVEQVLVEAGAGVDDLTDVAVGVGPGPFTGLRVALVTARTLAAVRGLPLHGVCTLDVIAAAVDVAGPFAVATDARRREVYWARYDGEGQRLGRPEVGRPGEVSAALAGLPVAGEGPVRYPEAFPHAIDPQVPSAAVLGTLVVRRLATGAPGLLPADPLYLRRPDATEPGPRKRVLV